MDPPHERERAGSDECDPEHLRMSGEGAQRQGNRNETRARRRPSVVDHVDAEKDER